MAKHDLPAYEQVKAFVKQHISSGTWRPGDAVPSESALQQQFGISRMTVNRAMRELAAEGLVTRVQGSGTRRGATAPDLVHAGHPRHPRGSRRARPSCTRTRVLAVEPEKAGADAGAVVRACAAGTRLFHTVLVHMENGVPIQWRTATSIRPRRPATWRPNFNATSPTLHLLQHAPLTEASYSIEAGLPSGWGSQGTWASSAAIPAWS